MNIAIAIILLLALLVVVLVVRAAMFVSKQVEPEPMDEIDIDGDKVAEHLAQSVRFKTISYQDASKFDVDEFNAMHAFLEEAFPKIFSTLPKEIIEKYSLLFEWKGSDPALKPMMLIAHMDVVPIATGTEADWTHPPFSGEIADGYIWGRGTFDDKHSLMAIFEAVEKLLTDGYQPGRTVYLAFGHDEEIGGLGGAKKIVAFLKSKGVELEYVLDEGGQITQGLLDGVNSPVAMIGIAEKGYMSVELTVESGGGHSSMPQKDTAIGMLSRALTDLNANQFPARLKGPTRQTLEYVGPEMSFGMKILLANMWLFGPMVTYNLASLPRTNATIRTTMAPTIFEAGEKENVLPQNARAVLNCRILPGSSIDEVLDHIRKIIGDERIKVRTMEFLSKPSEIADTASPSFKAIEKTIRQLFPDTLVAPYLSMVATDSRHYGDICDNVFRFLPGRVGPEDITRVHGTNERIGVENYSEIIRFYIQMIRNSN